MDNQVGNMQFMQKINSRENIPLYVGRAFLKK